MASIEPEPLWRRVLEVVIIPALLGLLVGLVLTFAVATVIVVASWVGLA